MTPNKQTNEQQHSWSDLRTETRTREKGLRTHLASRSRERPGWHRPK